MAALRRRRTDDANVSEPAEEAQATLDFGSEESSQVQEQTPAEESAPVAEEPAVQNEAAESGSETNTETPAEGEAAEPGKKITVCIFPVCPDRITVINAVGVYFEHTGSGTPENLKETEKNFLKGLHSITGNLAVLSESNCETKFADPSAAMDTLKNRANEQRRKELSLRRKVRL